MFRKKTFLVNDANKSNENGTTLGSSDGNDNDNGSDGSGIPETRVSGFISAVEKWGYLAN